MFSFRSNRVHISSGPETNPCIFSYYNVTQCGEMLIVQALRTSMVDLAPISCSQCIIASLIRTKVVNSYIDGRITNSRGKVYQESGNGQRSCICQQVNKSCQRKK